MTRIILVRWVMVLIVCLVLADPRHTLAAWTRTSMTSLGSFRTAQELTKECQEAAIWLAETAFGVELLYVPLYQGTSNFSMATYREMLEVARNTLPESSPPTIAWALKSQMIRVVHLLDVKAESASDMVDMGTYRTSNIQFQDALRRMLSLSRQLKRDCNLVATGWLFDPACYGEEAVEWYRRTFVRTFAFLKRALATQEMVARGRPFGESTEEYIARLTNQFEPFLHGQQAEETPPELATLQQLNVDLYALTTTVWKTVLTGKQTADQAQQAMDTMATLIAREQARLDIACPNP